jgi:hypothetical protein
MTSYAPNFTARFRVRYHAANANHVQTWRYPANGTLGIGTAAAQAAIQAYYDLIASDLYDDFAVISCAYAVEDTDIFLPYSSITVTGGTALPVGDVSVKAGAISLVGRTAGGQPAKIFQYGFSASNRGTGESQDFRINPGESASIDAAVEFLNALIGDFTLCGNDALGVTWYPYANVKDNDYWVKRVRQGS